MHPLPASTFLHALFTSATVDQVRFRRSRTEILQTAICARPALVGVYSAELECEFHINTPQSTRQLFVVNLFSIELPRTLEHPTLILYTDFVSSPSHFTKIPFKEDYSGRLF